MSALIDIVATLRAIAANIPGTTQGAACAAAATVLQERCELEADNAALRSLLTRAATGLAHLAHCRDCGEGNPRDCAHGRDALTALEDAMKHLHQTQAAATPTATDKEMNR